MAVKLMYDRQYILYNTSALPPREIVSVFILSISTQFYSRQSLSSFSSAVVCMTTDNRLDTLSNIHLAHRGIKNIFVRQRMPVFVYALRNRMNFIEIFAIAQRIAFPFQ